MNISKPHLCDVSRRTVMLLYSHYTGVSIPMFTQWEQTGRLRPLLNVHSEMTTLLLYLDDLSRGGSVPKFNVFRTFLIEVGVFVSYITDVRHKYFIAYKNKLQPGQELVRLDTVNYFEGSLKVFKKESYIL